MSTVSELALAARRWPLPEKDNAARGAKTAAASENNEPRYHSRTLRRRARRLPAYGRYLLTLRERGRVPAGVVLVSTGLWLQEQVPPGHLLVIPDDALVARIDFSVLAGLDACIVHDDHGVARACEIVNPILAVSPTWLAIANVERRVAATVLENGATALWPWGCWHWHVVDGDEALALTEAA
jgi:hypothetical protein